MINTINSEYPSQKLTIVMVAGEVSGDILASGLINSLKKKHPNAEFIGIAGPKMQASGCKAWYQMSELSVMGFVEVLGKLKRILSIRKDITKKILALKPDVFIGIDAPDFNLALEGKLKKAGIKTVHYVSPSVWAWKQKRVFKIKKNTDLMLCFLPFEKTFYDKHDVPCRFVGHKMADDIELICTKKESIKQKLNISNDLPILTLLPGSRHAEITLLAEPFIKAAILIKNKLPNLQILVPLTNEERKKEFTIIKEAIAPNLKLILLDGHAREAMLISNVAVVASGTATLECMLAKCPMVVTYKLKKLTYWIAKKLVKIPYVALPNILAGEKIVDELLQNECTPENIANHALSLLTSDNTQIKEKFLSLHNLIRCNADEKAANAILQLIDDNK